MNEDDLALSRQIAAVDYTLPLPPDFLRAVTTSVRRRRRRRLSLAAVSVMAVLGAAFLTVPGLNTGENRDQLASASKTPPAPTPTGIDRTAPGSVDGWRLDPPAGFRPIIPPGANSESPPSFYIAGLGPHGLSNNPDVPGPFPHEVVVYMRAWESEDHGRKLWLSVVRPRATPGDAKLPGEVAQDFAADEIERARAHYAEVRGVPNLPAGEATLFVTNRTNMILQSESRYDQVLRLDVSGVSEEELLRVAQTLRPA